MRCVCVRARVRVCVRVCVCVCKAACVRVYMCLRACARACEHGCVRCEEGYIGSHLQCVKVHHDGNRLHKLVERPAIHTTLDQ